jgi:serine/threonine-protein kinase
MHPPRADAPLILGGRYRVIERLGSGGMASVLLAEDERLGRLVAVKRLPTSSPEDALARFRREAQLGASLNHPNVVSIFDSAIDDDGLLIVMEYVEGESLKEQLLRGPLPPERAVAVLRQIGAALDHAHAAGVIHRDVKPSNVLIAKDGTAKLADLGIATAVDATSITTTNDVIGTLSYIAPERLEGAKNDPSADVYSLAAVAFEALSGEKAQTGTTPADVVGHRARDLRDAWPAAPAAAAEVLEDGLARDPERRPGSAGELVERLDSGLQGEETKPLSTDATATLPVQPPPMALSPAAAEAEVSSPRRGRFAAVAGLAAVAAGVAIAIAALGGGSGGDSKPPVKVRTRTQTVTTQTQTQPPSLTGDALGTQLNDRGYSLIQQGDYAAAIPILRHAVNSFSDGTSDVNYAYALYNLGHALRLAGQPEAAIPILEQRLQIADQSGTVAAELAQAQQEAGVATGGVGPGQKPPKGPKESKPGKGPKGAGGVEAD